MHIHPYPTLAARAPNPDVQHRYLIANTASAFLGLSAIILAVIALVIERVRGIRSLDGRRFTTNAAVLGCFHSNRVPWIKYLFGRRTKALCLPTITGLIEVGDRGGWTSSVLDLMTENHSEETWVKLYELIMTSIASKPEFLREEWKDQEPIPTFLKRMENDDHKKGHVSAMWQVREKAYATNKLISLRRELTTPGDAPTIITTPSSTSTTVVSLTPAPTKPAPCPISPTRNTNRGLSRLTSTWIVRDKVCIGVTREELAALCLIMGVSFPRHRPANALYLSGAGAFGLSLDISHADAAWSISMIQGCRLQRHLPSMGSGYTTLMAKHLACGSIPFAQTAYWVRSVYITDEVLNAIKTGGNIVHRRAYGGDSLEFLRRLPGDKDIDAFYGTLPPAAISNPGAILHQDGTTAGTWPAAVTELAFGGLAPQANPNVASAVSFTVGGTNLGVCIENLERLVDVLQELDPEDSLFGENVRERCHASSTAFVNYTFPSQQCSPPDAAAVFARYTNLIERVVALCVGHAEVSTLGGNGVQLVTQDDVFNAVAEDIEKTYRAAVSSINHINSQYEETAQDETDLGTLLSSKTTNIKTSAKLNTIPIIELSDCASIIRCVLAAWAYTVPYIEVRQAASSEKPPSPSPSSSNCARQRERTPVNEIALASLPPVSAFY